MKVGSIRKIKFWSLDLFGCDREARAVCRVVLREDGTKMWQLVNEDLYTTEQDEDCLSMCDIEDVEIIK